MGSHVEKRKNSNVFRGNRRENQLGVLSTGDTRENLKRIRFKDVYKNQVDLSA